MMFRSIRSRLALSFAGIALVAAIVLGVVLLAILQNYYSNQELDYLRGNAQAISEVITPMILVNTPHDEVQSQIENLAFLSQTRIQVYNPDGQLLYDSGSPQDVKLNLGVVKHVMLQTKGSPSKDMVFISVSGPQNDQLPPFDTAPSFSSGAPDSGDVFIYRSVQAGGSTFGFELKLNSDAAHEASRSGLSIAEIVRDPRSNNELVSVKLSEGPAYGSAILTSVAQGWVLASAIAVLLAAAVGWYISRRISAPVLALTDATARMAQGDLSSRADVRSRDEFGQLARSFNEMADQVETTVTALRSFVSDAAHELRTPLTALRTNLEIALEGREPTDRAVFIERAQTMVKRLEELNTNLLDLSRLQANGQVANLATVDLTELLRARSEIYASQAEQASLEFEVELSPTPVFIRADASQITRAMDNLLDNACKFTPQGGTVRVSLLEQEGQSIFSVADTGIGIPADELSQIFNRFHRGRNTNAYPGNGLGLAIVNAIVTTYGGQADVESAGEGKGSKFSFRLPVVPPQNI